MSQRAVVIGGTGFLGRNAGCALARAGYEVVPVARHRVPDMDVQCMDLAHSSASAVRALFDATAPDVVVNASGTLWRQQDSNRDDEAVVKALLAAPTRFRLIHIGTTYEYGERETSATETSPTEPTTPYGKRKATDSAAVIDSGRDAVVLRVSTVVGPHTPARSLLGTVLQSLRIALHRGDRTVVVPPLSGSGDFLDARDFGAAVVRAAGAAVSGRTFNIAAGVQTPVSQLVVRLIDRGSTALSIASADAPHGGERRRGATTPDIDIRSAADLLDWVPTHDLDDTLDYLWRTEGART